MHNLIFDKLLFYARGTDMTCISYVSDPANYTLRKTRAKNKIVVVGRLWCDYYILPTTGNESAHSSI